MIEKVLYARTDLLGLPMIKAGMKANIPFLKI